MWESHSNIIYPRSILITSPHNVMGKVRDCWGNRHATRLMLMLSAGVGRENWPWSRITIIKIKWPRFRRQQASFSEIFAIKHCYFLALIFVERSEKLSAKKARDVNVGQVKKSGKLKTQCFSSRFGAEIMVVCTAINLERTSNLSSKVASSGYNWKFFHTQRELGSLTLG